MFTHPRIVAVQPTAVGNGHLDEKKQNGSVITITQKTLPPPSIFEYPALFIKAIQVVRSFVADLAASNSLFATHSSGLHVLYSVLSCGVRFGGGNHTSNLFLLSF
jgi:hypothetical protein